MGNLRRSKQTSGDENELINFLSLVVYDLKVFMRVFPKQFINKKRFCVTFSLQERKVSSDFATV
jgi:hypothetical protein